MGPYNGKPSDKNIVSTKLDKRNITVVMDNAKYVNKFNSMLSDFSTYTLLTKDPTVKSEMILNSFISELFKSDKISK